MELLEKKLTEKVLGGCFEVSNELGGGFLESVYQKAVALVLREKGLKVDVEVPLKVKFRGHIVGDFYADILIENRLIIEMKSVKALNSEHEARL